MSNLFKYMSVFSIILMFVIVVQLALYIWVVVWIYKVSKDKTCTCAKNWRRLYIVIFPIISFLMVIPMNLMPESYYYLTPWLQFPEVIGWILFIVFAFQYIHVLKKMKCECAIKDKSGDNALLTMSIVQIVLYVLSFTSIISIVSVFGTKVMNMIK
jgi:hypothetical protein